MTALSIQPPYPPFLDRNGVPLKNGYIWIGTAATNPTTNPINVYWDAALTQPAAQPIRTLNGYPVNSGTPGRLYVNGDYSIMVLDAKGTLIYSAPNATERYSAVVVSGATANSVTVIFRRSAAEPATPAPSSGVPVDWYDDVADVPAGADPIWLSFGQRPSTDANWTWQKPLRLGADEAKTLRILADSLFFFVDAQDNFVGPATPTITFTLALQNLTGNATWTCERFAVDGTSIDTITLGGTGNTRTLTSTQFDEAFSAVVTATLDGISDAVRIYRGAAPAVGVGPQVFEVTAVDVQSITNVDAEVAIRLNPDGTVEKREGLSASFAAAGNWYEPTTGAIGANYEVAVTVTGSALSTGTLTRQVLSSARTWVLTQPEGGTASKSNLLLFQIYSGTSLIPIATGYGSMSAVYESGA